MKKRNKRIKLSKIDKFMFVIIGILFASILFVQVYSSSALSKSNIDLERLKNKIEKQETINESISMKINEIASLSNIQDVAKEFGLSYQNDNIIVVK